MKRRLDPFPYFLLSPALLATLLIVFLPILQTTVMSLFHYVLWQPKETRFILFGNYLQAFRDPVFWSSFQHTAIWIVGAVGLQLLLGMAAALLLNRKFAWRGLARSLILIPWVTPSVITSLMWRWMYDGNRGVINDLLVRLGILDRFFPWLASSSTALGAVIVVLMWQGFPFFAIMILAGLQAIPNELYEAAQADGASVVQRYFRITLPMLVPVLFTSLLLRIIWVANSMDVIYVMTGGGPGYSTYTLPVYSFLKAYKGMDFGYASALSILLTLFLVVFVAGYVVKVVRSEAL